MSYGGSSSVIGKSQQLQVNTHIPLSSTVSKRDLQLRDFLLILANRKGRREGLKETIMDHGGVSSHFCFFRITLQEDGSL